METGDEPGRNLPLVATNSPREDNMIRVMHGTSLLTEKKLYALRPSTLHPLQEGEGGKEGEASCTRGPRPNDVVFRPRKSSILCLQLVSEGVLGIAGSANLRGSKQYVAFVQTLDIDNGHELSLSVTSSETGSPHWTARTLCNRMCAVGVPGSAAASVGVRRLPLMATTGQNSSDGSRVLLWDPTHLNPVGEMPDHRCQLCGIASLPDRGWVSSGGYDAAFVDDVQTCKEVCRIACPSKLLYGLAAHRSHDTLWCGGSGDEISVVSVRDGTCVAKPFVGHWTRDILCCEDKHMVVCEVGGGLVMLFDDRNVSFELSRMRVHKRNPQPSSVCRTGEHTFVSLSRLRGSDPLTSWSVRGWAEIDVLSSKTGHFGAQAASLSPEWSLSLPSEESLGNVSEMAPRIALCLALGRPCHVRSRGAEMKIFSFFAH